MEVDWLFDFPNGEEYAKIAKYTRKRLKADPVAAAVPDDEAEAFLVSALCIRGLARKELPMLWRVCGVRVSDTGERSRRRATYMVLRRWTTPRVRLFLTFMCTNTINGPFPDVARFPAFWTPEAFRRAYWDGDVNIAWLVVIRRALGPLDNLSEWLASVDKYAEKRYRIWLDIGRLTWRRVLYPDPVKDAPVGQVKKSQGAAQAALVAETAPPPTKLAQELREKDRHTGALRQDVRRLEQDRKALREQSRRSQLQAQASLSQARGDVAAAQKALQERLAAQKKELADQARAFEKQIQALREQIDTARADFAHSLAEWKRRPDLQVLAGRTVTLSGSAPDALLARLQVESLGGRLVAAGGDVVLPAPTGCAGLEQSLQRLAMQRVLIKCDGLYRKMTGKPGIAISGFQAYFGAVDGYADSAVTCCGPLASSLMGEYGGVAMALTWLREMDPAPGSQLEIWSDCKVMLNLIRAKRVIDPKPGCITLNRMVWQLRRHLERRGCTVQFRWVPREQVHAVDRLCAGMYHGLIWYRRRLVARPRASLDAFLKQLRQGAHSV